jgi:large subunit ribosomal protein L3
MLSTIFAKKTAMTGKFTPKGNRVGVTVLTVPQMFVKDSRTAKENGYTAVRIEVSGKGNKKMIREIRTDEVIDSGTELKFEEVIKVGDKVNISGISKGKGFAGVVKRYGFAGGPRTHGQSDRERAPGSSGSTTTPGRVFRGTKRSGDMGNERIMMKKLKVLEVNPENRTLVVVGSVPGFSRRGMLLTVSKSA